MKLRNKKTGEIIDFASVNREYDGANDIGLIEIGHERGETIPLYSYSSLAELNEEWEDYHEEPKEYWYVSCDGRALKATTDEDDYNEKHIAGHKEIGNYFETKEEAEKAVEKLKAVKRLKDTYHIRFDLDFVKNTISFTYRIDGTLLSVVNEERIIFEDMQTIFGGEE